jgi:two-component system chemotaxis response regulator CheY
LARKILLADDSVTAQNMGRKILADAGYEVITVNNGSAALKKISEQKPDLIVLDVYMPGYSGLEVCQRIKEVPETGRIPVLLTVGKLEPFKPEEAKRVRAEGYIVKPFEASELLSALSKLEDKIVPRSEPSKPGRFARAIAAVEQSNRDKVMAVEEETGWKNRISFPSKNKKRNEDEEGRDDPSVYTVNRDLQAVVPSEEPHKHKAATGKEGMADVAAAAPAEFPKDGLPKDVTPEEIAAIAAAAAQVQAATAVSKESSDAPAEAKTEEPRAEQKSGENVEAKSDSKVEEAPPVTFAKHKSGEERIETAEATVVSANELQKDASAVPSQADVVSAISALESGNGKAWKSSGSGNGAGHSAAQPPDLPVTMAATAASGSSAGPRWTAVPAAIDAAEAAISLEQEMQKAHAAPASPAAEPFARISTHEETELAHALSAAANVSQVAVAPAVIEPASSHIDSLPAAPVEFVSPVQSTEASRPEAGPPEIAQEAPAPPRNLAEREAEKEVSIASTESPAPSRSTEDASSAAPPEPQSMEPVSAVAEGRAGSESAAGVTEEMAEKRDSEVAATTAAAWASWQQVRSDEPRTPESAKSPQRDDVDAEPASASEPAAMAVAAGAEKSPEEGAPGADPRAIANIVDSVLAELRPKIVAEISKKLGEKK